MKLLCYVQEFCDELAYWVINESYMMPCCTPKIMEKEEEEPDLFLDVRHGNVRRKIWNFCEGDGTRMSTIFSIISIGFVIISVSGLVVGSIRDFQVPINRTKVYWDLVPGAINETDGEPVYEAREVTNTRWEPHPYFEVMEVSTLDAF